MSISAAQLKVVREAIGVAIDRGTLNPATVTKLTQINQLIINGTYSSLRSDADGQAAITELHEAVTDVGVYADAVEAFANDIGASSSSPTPAPTPAQTPTQATPEGIVTVRAPTTLSEQEIVVFRDLNFFARRDYRTLETNSAYQPRLLTMSYALRDNASWTDPDPSYLLGMMAATKDGQYELNRAVIDKYASDVGLLVKSVAAPTSAPPATSPLPTPTNPLPAPPAVVYEQWNTTPTPLVAGPSGASFAREVLDVLRNNTVRFDQHVGFGMDPIQNAEARITLREGQIIGASVSNFQNDDEQMLPAGVTPMHAGVLDICNSDGGGRWLQYCWFYMGKMVRNTLNRVPTIRAMFDSMGDGCWSGDESRAKGQLYYERIDYDRKKITLTAFQPGWEIEIRGSSVYGANDIDLVEQTVRRVLAEKGL